MQLSPIAQLSQELIDQIIDAVALVSSWPKDLHDCALVCRSFLPHSQKHIFRRIRFFSGDIDFQIADRLRRCGDLYRILRRNPTIADYVLELHLEISDRHQSWITQDKTFIAIMELITNSNQSLQTFILQRSPGSYVRLKNPQAFMRHFFRPYLAGSVTGIEINGVANVSIEMFERCTQLRCLKLLGAELEDGRRHVGNHTVRPRPHTLECCEAPGALAHLSRVRFNGMPASFDFSRLHFLVIGTAKLPDLSVEQEIVDAAGDSLHFLTLKCEPEHHHSLFRGYINLEKASHLREFEIHLAFGHRSAEENALATLRRILSTVSSDNHLEELNFTCAMGFLEPTEPNDVLDPSWLHVESELRRIIGNKSFTFSICMIYRDQNPLTNCYDNEIRRTRWREVRSLCVGTLQELEKRFFSAWTRHSRITLLTEVEVDVA